MGAFWPPSSPSRYVSSDAFSQAKVLSVPGKRELTVPAREAPPTVETDLMELDMYFVGPPRKTLFKALSLGGAVACSILHQRITSKDCQKPQTIPKRGRQKEVDAQHLEII